MCRKLSVLTKHNLLHQSDAQQKSLIADWRLLDANIILQLLTFLNKIRLGAEIESPKIEFRLAGSLSVRISLR